MFYISFSTFTLQILLVDRSFPCLTFLILFLPLSFNDILRSILIFSLPR